MSKGKNLSEQNITKKKLNKKLVPYEENSS